MDKNEQKKNKTGQLQSYMSFMLLMLLLLIAVNVFVYLQEFYSGLIMTAGLIVYLVVIIAYYNVKKKKAVQALVEFALDYEKLQNKMIDDFSFPYVLVGREGDILWGNKKFIGMFQENEKLLNHKISDFIPEITHEKLPRTGSENEVNVEFGDRIYKAKMKLISEKSVLGAHRFPDVKPSLLNRIYAIEFFDETEMYKAIKKQEDESMAAVIVYIDNYEEAMESVEEVTQSIFTAFMDRKITQFFGAYDCIIRKYERDKFLIIMQNHAVRELMEKRFPILEEIKNLENTEIKFTLSLGIGFNQGTYKKNVSAARMCIELALGRGGDQAVVKNGDSIKYFGGKAQGIEKNTRVKARVKARALHEFISSAEKVVVMGHKLMDVDAFGAAVGIARAGRSINKKTHIVIDSESPALKPVIEEFRSSQSFDPSLFVTREQAIAMTNEKTLLIVVDTSRPNYTECKELLSLAKNIVVLDHHRISSDLIKNSMLSYIEPYASSTCEMVAEILQYFDEDIKIRPIEADVLYAGIVVDTDNFVQKTGVRTFEAAAYLRRKGADVTRVRKLFRENMNEYLAKGEAIRNVKLLRNCYAVTVCPSEGIEMPTIVAAQTANELLNIVGVKASFVLTHYKEEVYISARSIDEVNVQIIMERLGGGGHLNIAGCQLPNISIEEAFEKLEEVLFEMLDGGEI